MTPCVDATRPGRKSVPQNLLRHPDGGMLFTTGIGALRRCPTWSCVCTDMT